MTLVLDFFPRADSPIHRLDARWKLAGILLAVVGTALLQTLPAAGTLVSGTAVLQALLPATGALLVAVILLIISRLPARWYLTRIGTVVLFVGFFALFLPFVVPASEAEKWRIDPLVIRLPGLVSALRLLAKATAILTLMLVLLATTPPEATFKAAHSLHMPGLLVQLAMLTVRYTFLFAGELTRMRVALRVRGYRNRVSRHSYRTVGHVAGTLLVRGYERAERVGQAMRCRAFDGRFRSVTEFHTTAADVLFFAILVSATAALVTCDWWLR
jgi:cobalt/nickel transport system permease protein